MSIPFGERGGPVRGLLDAASGRYPRFVVGGGIAAGLLPVFHFHDVSVADLEPKLRYLAENGYRTATADEIAAHARGTIRLDGRRVGLCFDDAWASLWTIAAPLLKRYGLTAVAYVIPARVDEAAGCRRTIDDGAADAAGPPLATWPEIQALHDSGIVDVQCHTDSHSMVFCSRALVGFVTPAYASRPMLNRPQLSPRPGLRFLEPDQLGAPLYEARSRMSDGRRIRISPDAQARCVEHVAAEGGAAFFTRREWERRLRGLLDDDSVLGVESEDERRRAIDEELDRGRSILNARLRTTTVTHLCFPWGVSGEYAAAAAARHGFRSAVANRLRGMLAVRPGDDPYWLKRLPNRYIFHLPGRGRRLRLPPAG